MTDEARRRKGTIVSGRLRLGCPGGAALSAALVACFLASASLIGQESDEESSAPDEVLSCDLDFAVMALASAWGEPATVRRCPEAEGEGTRDFARHPILEGHHVDSVAVEASGGNRRRVVVRWTEEGGRKMFTYWDHSPPDPVSIVVDGEVVSEFELSDGGTTDGVVVMDGVPPERAEEFAGRLRTLVGRAGSNSDGPPSVSRIDRTRGTSRPARGATP